MLRIFDGKTETLVAILDNREQACPYWDAVHTEQINGVNTLEFTCPADHEVSEYVVEGNLVAIEDPEGDYQLFQIMRVEESRADGPPVKTAFCEHAALELLDEIIEDKRPYGVSAQYALMVALEGTRWQVGQVDNLGQNSVNFYYESVLSAIQKILNTWGGEVRYRVTIEHNQITGRFIDILDRRGDDRGRMFRYGKDIVSARRTIDLSNVKTALYGRGKGEETEEGYGRRITFADVEWKVANGDPVDKPLGQEWIGDPEALARWGRENGTRHRFGVFEDPDIEDPAELLRRTWEELQRLKEPLISYEAQVVDLEQLPGYEHEIVRLGDTVRVIDETFRPALELEARVIELRRHLTEPDRTEVVLGNFLPLITDDAERLRRLEARLHDRQGIWDDKLKRGDKIPTSWLDGVIDVLNNELHSTGGYVYITDQDGILILDKPRDQNPTKALQLKGGVFAIADSKNPDGTWRWRTFGDGTGFTASEIKTGTLFANLVNILAGNYVRLDGNGLTVTDPNNTERVKLGEYSPGRYGLRVVGGEIYSTTIRTSEPGSNNYVYIGSGFQPLTIVQNGRTALEIFTLGGGGAIHIRDTNDNERRGIIATYNDVRGKGLGIFGVTDTGVSSNLLLEGNPVHITGPYIGLGVTEKTNVDIYGSLYVSGSKNAVQETDSYGRRLLYARESPESRYVDEGFGVLENGECRIQLDPIFLECIEPDSAQTPWFIHVMPYADVDLFVAEIGADYFVVREKGGGTTSGARFAWSLSAVRREYAGVRMPEHKVLSKENA